MSNCKEDTTQTTGLLPFSTPERRIIYVSVYDPGNVSGEYGEDTEAAIAKRIDILNTETGLFWQPIHVASSVFAPTNLGYEDGGHVPTLFLTIIVEPFFGLEAAS